MDGGFPYRPAGKRKFQYQVFCGKIRDSWWSYRMPARPCKPAQVEIGEIERLSGVQDKSIAVVVLDIDPAVDPGFIAKHYHDQPGFSGYTAHSSEDMTLNCSRIWDHLLSIPK